MKHRVAKTTLNRTHAERKSLSRNLASELIEHERITTTLAKAKFFRPYVEKLITKARKIDKNDKISVFNTIKYLRARLSSEKAVRKLVEDLGTKFSNRRGGYVRIIKTGNRAGDNAPMARVELVETEKKLQKTVVKEKEALKSKIKPSKKRLIKGNKNENK